MSLANLNLENLDAESLARCLSLEPEKQRIELAFLHRITEVLQEESANALRSVAKSGPEEQFFQAYAQMQSPVFRMLSAFLERSVPQEKGFGKFRARD